MAELLPSAARMRQESFKLSVDDFQMLCDLADTPPSRSRSAVLRDLIHSAAGALPCPKPGQRVTKKKAKQPKASPPPTRLPPDPELLRLLVKLGNLLNQIARGLHAARHLGNMIDLAVLHFLLVVMRIEFENLRENYTEAKGAEVLTPSTGGQQP